MSALVEKIEAFLAEHGAAIAVRHGEPLSRADVTALLTQNDIAMPASLRAVLERWGYLELEVASELWPHSTFHDGLRFFGGGADVPKRLSLASQVAEYRAMLEAVERRAKEYGEKPSLSNSNFKQAKGRSPTFSTLEGLADSWCANSKSVAWFNDYAHFSIRGGVLPKDSPLFEVTDPAEVLDVLLGRLAYRAKRARQLSSLVETLRSLGDVEVRGDQRLLCSATREIEWYVWPTSGEPSVRAVRRVGFLDPHPAEESLGHGTFVLRGYPEGDEGRSPVLVSLGLAPGTPIDATLVRDVEIALARGDALARGERTTHEPSRDVAAITIDKAQLDDFYSPESWVAK